jgi:serine/threonine-protein kinase
MAARMLDDYFGILGRTLAGTFRVEEVIAEGGYALVYRAEHVAFRAPVAIKCLRIPSSVAPAQILSFVESFREEAEILFHLSASIPEVVRPLHSDVITLADGTYVPYLVMEWVEGKPLDSIIILREREGKPPLSLREVLPMLAPIARAIGQAHRFETPDGKVVSVTHCDLKPENIVIIGRGGSARAKILDFGVAKARDVALERVGHVEEGEASPFTPNYGAPEQWAPRRYGQTGPWTDVWGLALTVAECVIGRPVFEGDLRTIMDAALDGAERPTPRAFGAPVSEEVDAVFERALAVDPRDRYGTIESFWRALSRASGVTSSLQRPPPPPPGALARPARPAEPAGPAPGAAADLDEPFEGAVPAAPVEQAGAEPEPAPEPAAADDPDPTSGEFFLPPAARPRMAPPRRRSAEPAGRGDPAESSGVRRFDLDGADSDDAPISSRRPTDVRAGSAEISLDTPLEEVRRPAAPRPIVTATPKLAPATAARPAPVAAGRSAGRDLRRALVLPVVLVLLALVLTYVDGTMAAAGQALDLGPIRVRWIAWSFAGLGVGLALWALISSFRQED